MPERSQPIVLPLGNVGFATDMPVQTRQFTHYTRAENVIYELDGAVRKVGGDSRINSSAIGSTPAITGMYDFWRGGGAAAFTQKFVAVTANSKIYKDDMDGTFDDITGSVTVTANAIPVFCHARDLLIICTDKNDAPIKWNQSGNAAALGGSPPTARGMVYHANRAWAWGVNANASRLYYSSSTDVEDWSGSDTGSIDFDPEDGDRIVGAASYKKRLFIFKGPNKGSIHFLNGTAPTGADAFSKDVLTRNIPLQTHNSIINVGDDIWFMSDRGIHSLSATNDSGDFQGADLSRFLSTYFRDTVFTGKLNQVWGVNYQSKGCALWVLPVNGSTVNNAILGCSYNRAQEDGLKWFTWSRSGASIALRTTPTTLVEDVVTGSYNGFALKQDQASRSITPSTAYAYQLTTPWILTGEQDAAGQCKPYVPATMERLAMRSISVGDHNIDVQLTTDMGVSSSHHFNQGDNFTSSQGAIFGQAIFGQVTFGGALATRGPQFGFTEPGEVAGEGRVFKLDITQGGLNEDAHAYEICLERTSSAYSTE